MSLEQVKAFITAVQADDTLRKEAETLGRDIDGLLNMAEREGFTFNEADFIIAVREQGYELEQNLSDEELSAVTGGTGPAMITDSTTNWPECSGGEGGAC